MESDGGRASPHRGGTEGSAPFADLFEENFERIYAFVVRRVGDRNHAQDLTSEIFQHALANLQRFEWRGVPTAFLRQAFDATEIAPAVLSPEGTIMHTEMRIGDSIIEMGEAHGPWQPMPMSIHLYVGDADAVYERALKAGGTSNYPPRDMPHGERSGGIVDPFGNTCFVATTK